MSTIPRGQSAHLYLYTDFRGGLAWAKDPQEWRTLTKRSGKPLRAAYSDTIAIPDGYKLTGPLAFHGIERKRDVMRDLINALT